jgi:prevent-host-death family protein
MKTATIREIRNHFPRVLAWVNGGEEVTVLNRSRPVARLLPPRPVVSRAVTIPDFAARAQAIFGHRKTHLVEALLREREERRC